MSNQKSPPEASQEEPTKKTNSLGALHTDSVNRKASLSVHSIPPATSSEEDFGLPSSGELETIKDSVGLVAFPVTAPPAKEQASKTTGSPRSFPMVGRKYEIEEEIARGGMGRVLRAKDQTIERHVALKESLLEEHNERFQKEALLTARLQHPSIVPVYEVGCSFDGKPFYSMPVVSDRSLARAIREAKTLNARLSLLPSMIAACDAVAYAHNKKIIHRDLKPDNILLGEFGETVIIDWGLARSLQDNEQDSVGTAEYMSPEQAQGKRIDERSDVYSLGATLYELCAGEPPFTGQNAYEIIAKLAQKRPRSLVRRQPEISPVLAAIVEKAIAFAPEDRYQNAKELADDLRKFQAGQLVGAHRYSTWQLIKRWLKRHRTAVTVAAVAAVFIAVVSVVAVVQVIQQRDAANLALTAALEEQGRQELLAGNYDRALAILAKAYERDPSSKTLRFMLSEAARPFDSQLRVLNAAGPASVVAFSPDGKRVLVASTTGEARLYNPNTGALLVTLLGHKSGISTASFSADGTRLITGSWDKTAKVWDTQNGQLVTTLSGHQEVILSARFNEDGKYAITSSQDGAAVVWEVAQGNMIQTIRGAGPIYDASFDQKPRVILASADNLAVIFNLLDGTSVNLEHEAPVTSASFSADGGLALTASNNQVCLFNTSTGKRLSVRQKNAANTISLSRLQAKYLPGQNRILEWSNYSEVAYLLSPDDLSQLFELRMVGHRINTATWSMDGSLIATASDDGSIYIWETSSGRLRATLLGHKSSVWSASFSPDGESIATASFDGTARIWSTQGNLVAELDPDERPQRAIYSRNGQYLCVTAAGSPMKLLNPTTGAVLFTKPGSCQGISSDNERFLTQSGNSFDLWSTTKGQNLASWQAPEEESAIFSPDGTRIFALKNRDTLVIRDGKTGGLLKSLPLSKEIRPSRGLWDISPDGTKIAMSSSTPENSSVVIVDTNTGESLLSIQEAADDIVYSPDGERLAVSNQETVSILNAKTGELILYIVGHERDVKTPVFSSGGDILATPSSDGTLRLWDAIKGQPLWVIHPYMEKVTDYTGSVLSVSFSPDNKNLVTTGEGGAVRIWELKEETRSPAQMNAFVQKRVAWRFEAGRLLPIQEERPTGPIPSWYGTLSVIGERAQFIPLLDLKEKKPETSPSTLP